jgi:arsenate reductase
MTNYNVLFLCTGNSARSILAEAILNEIGAPHFKAWSAGSQPKGQVHPMSIDLLRQLGHPVGGLRSKSWGEFELPGAPEFDFIFTVCDNAANEACPIWLGHPASAHWGIPDPAAEEGSEAEKRLAFADAYRQMKNRISALIALPIASLDRIKLKSRLDEIGRMQD